MQRETLVKLAEKVEGGGGKQPIRNVKQAHAKLMSRDPQVKKKLPGKVEKLMYQQKE